MTMTNLKKLLAATVAVAALGAGTAQAAVSVTSAVTYVATTAAPAASTILSGMGSFVVDASVTTTNVGWDTLFTSGNQIKFTLSQGTFANTPTITGGAAGTTYSFIDGGAGKNFVTIQLTAVDSVAANKKITISAIQVQGVTNTADSGDTDNPTAIALTVSTNGTALNSTPAAGLVGNVATFGNLITATAPKTAGPQIDLTTGTPLGSTYKTTNNFGVAKFTVNAVKLYDGSSITLGAATFTLNIPLASGSITVADSTASTCTGNTVALTAKTLAATNTIPGSATNFTTCDFLVAPTSLSKVAIAAGPASLGYSIVAGTGATASPATANLSGAVALLPTTYVGAETHLATYVVGDDASFSTYINVYAGAAGTVAVTNGSVSATLGSLKAGEGKLYSITEIKDALVKAGAPSTIYANAGVRAPLTFILPTGSILSPTIYNKQTNTVTQIGGGFSTQTSKTN